MRWPDAYGGEKSLGELLSAPLEREEDEWLFIPIGTLTLAFDTPCSRRLVVVRDLSPEEQDELEEQAKAMGLKPFLATSQLVEVVENLRSQLSAPSNQDLLFAVEYYWAHDAFVQVPRRA